MTTSKRNLLADKVEQQNHIISRMTKMLED